MEGCGSDSGGDYGFVVGCMPRERKKEEDEKHKIMRRLVVVILCGRGNNRGSRCRHPHPPIANQKQQYTILNTHIQCTTQLYTVHTMS